MTIQIAFDMTGECERALIERGFEKRTFYVKEVSGAIPIPPETLVEAEVRKGDKDFLAMDIMPFQFATVSHWGLRDDWSFGARER